MRRILLLMALLCLCALPIKAQDYLQSYNFSGAGTSPSSPTFASTGTNAFLMSWHTTGVIFTCSVQVDSSADGSSWGNGDLIAAQTCTSDGVSSVATLSSGKNYVRVHVTALTGNGSAGLNVTVKGMVSSGGVNVTTVSGLSSYTAQKIAIVTDGASATDCTVGGGSTTVTCQYSGTAWAALGSTGNGTTTIVSSGLMADYQMQEGSGTTIADATGQQSAGTFGANPPAWTTTQCGNGTGSVYGYNTQIETGPCLRFSGNNTNVQMPSALNSAQTIQILLAFDPTYQSFWGNTQRCPIAGSTSTASGICFFRAASSGANSSIYGLTGLNNNAIGTGVPQLSLGGIFVLTLTTGSPGLGYINDVPITDMFQTPSFNLGNVTPQTTGQYLLGGTGAGTALNPGFFDGDMWRVVFYNRVLTKGEVAQNAAALLTWGKTTRGVTPGLGASPTVAANEALIVGDSIAAGKNSSFGWFGTAMSLTTLNGLAWSLDNQGLSGQQLGAMGLNNAAGFSSPSSMYSVLGSPFTPLFYIAQMAMHPKQGANMVVLLAGTNDICSSGTPANNVNTAYGNLVSDSKYLRTFGTQVAVTTVLSRSTTGCDAARDTYNTLVRNHWPEFSDALIDLASNPQIGADGASASTTYFNADGIHPSGTSSPNILANLIQKGINRYYGNRNFSSATTYVAAAPAATATTALSESGNTVTVTMASNPFTVGQCVTVAGVTPAGYNTPAGLCSQVLSATATQITYYDATSGLGAGSVMGTVAVPLQADGDQYIVLNFGAGNFTLESCQGFTGQNIYIRNINAGGTTLVPFGSETITGPGTTTVAANTTAILQAQLVSASAAGCNWVRLQ